MVPASLHRRQRVVRAASMASSRAGTPGGVSRTGAERRRRAARSGWVKRRPATPKQAVASALGGGTRRTPPRPTTAASSSARRPPFRPEPQNPRCVTKRATGRSRPTLAPHRNRAAPCLRHPRTRSRGVEPPAGSDPAALPPAHPSRGGRDRRWSSETLPGQRLRRPCEQVTQLGDHFVLPLHLPPHRRMRAGEHSLSQGAQIGLAGAASAAT